MARTSKKKTTQEEIEKNIVETHEIQTEKQVEIVPQVEEKNLEENIEQVENNIETVEQEIEKPKVEELVGTIVKNEAKTEQIDELQAKLFNDLKEVKNKNLNKKITRKSTKLDFGFFWNGQTVD